MKTLVKIFRWLLKVWRSIMGAKPITIETEKQNNAEFGISYAEDVPSPLPEKTIFVIQDGNAAELLAFKCPCGCGSDILLNLLKDANPQWRYGVENGTISISPSIWRTTGCKSHFFVRESNVVWV